MFKALEIGVVSGYKTMPLRIKICPTLEVNFRQ